MIVLPAAKPPDWKGHTPPCSFGDLHPKDRFGLPVTWIEKEDPIPVFLDQYVIGPKAHDAYLMGVRFDTSKMLVNGRPGAEGFFLLFLVVEFIAANRHVLHVLRQHRSPIYSVASDGKDWVWASEVKKAERGKLLLGFPPAWEESEAQWPTVGGKTMRFVGQLNLPKNDVTRVHLTWDKRIYLFWQSIAEASEFKLFAQDCDLQTAKEHYTGE